MSPSDNPDISIEKEGSMWIAKNSLGQEIGRSPTKSVLEKFLNLNLNDNQQGNHEQ